MFYFSTEGLLGFLEIVNLFLKPLSILDKLVGFKSGNTGLDHIPPWDYLMGAHDLHIFRLSLQTF